MLPLCYWEDLTFLDRCCEIAVIRLMVKTVLPVLKADFPSASRLSFFGFRTSLKAHSRRTCMGPEKIGSDCSCVCCELQIAMILGSGGCCSIVPYCSHFFRGLFNGTPATGCHSRCHWRCSCFAKHFVEPHYGQD